MIAVAGTYENPLSSTGVRVCGRGVSECVSKCVRWMRSHPFWSERAGAVEGTEPQRLNSSTHTHTYIHAYTHTYIHTYTNTYIHTHMHTYTNTYTHTYIHTHNTALSLQECSKTARTNSRQSLWISEVCDALHL